MNHNKLTIIRGIPGSGKTTLARALSAASIPPVPVFEADMYFEKNGKYEFDMNRIGDAHDWCQNMVDCTLSLGGDVIVSNTFTTIRELKPYFEIAKKRGIMCPNVITCQSNYGSIHGVPDDTLEKMKARFTYNLTPLYDEFYGTTETDQT